MGLETCFGSHVRWLIRCSVTPQLENQEANLVVTKAIEVFRTAWPPAAIGLAVVVNSIWIGALGYAISRLF